jgi:hypothetical protein
MPIKLRPKQKSDLLETLASASREVRKWPVRVCGDCNGRKVRMYEVYSGGYDREYEEGACGTCGGEGTTGGGQPGLHLYFQSTEECESFKAKIARMRGITWVADREGSDTLEAEGKVPWKA